LVINRLIYRDMQMSSARPSLSYIAKCLNVSAATVSNALSGKGRVSAELAARIRAMADELGYVPGSAGRALRTGRSQVLGLVLPDISNPLFPQIAQAVEHAAAAAGYGVLIADSRNDVARQTEAIDHLIEHGVDGIVIVPRRGTRIVDVGRPFALIDSPSTPGNTVSGDHWQGGHLMAQHLAGLGHRKILLIGNSPDSNVQNDRIGGLRAGLGPAIECQTIWAEAREPQHGPTSPLGLAAWFACGFTAYATVSDTLALRALTELLGAGIAVPAQASVTGFDDLPVATAVHPALTTMRVDMARIAALAIGALIDAIEAADPAASSTGSTGPVRLSPPEDQRVPMALIVRQTSAVPPVPPSSENQTP
jgi:LacI family transcriptional regulator